MLVAALSAFVVGWFWYGSLFGKLCMKLNGFTPEMLQDGKGLSMPLIMILNYVATVLAAFAIAMFVGSEADMSFGVFAGFMISVF